MPAPRGAPARTWRKNESRADWMLGRLASAGLRMTGQREVVVRTIASKARPFAPEGLVDELRARGVGRATVYRALERLERLGMLARIHVGDCQGYTVCDEGHHHHLVCGACHAVVPIEAGAVEREIQKLAARLQFRVDAHMLEFAGECADCLAKAG
jgi:Fur family ferric uptake transcriptional regulator